MAKISLISWRRRGKKLPDTQAQRRARAREQSAGIDQSWRHVGALDVPIAPPFSGLYEFDEDHLMAERKALALLGANKHPGTIDITSAAPSKPWVSLELTAAQSHALRALPLFSKDSGENGRQALFQLSKLQDHRGITLQFSLQAEAIPEMISLKEVCRHLKVGRRTIMRLIRRRELRCYRIAHRYRFAVEDVKHYLDRIATY
jgi:excisionase family DNA binding protein